MIKIGTSGFSFKDWVGPVYPEGFNLKEALEYYEKKLGFDCVEINSTYYALISEKSFISMAERTGKDFLFTVKVFKGITHDPFDYRLREKPGIDRIKEYISRFIYSLKPLEEAGKLAGILFQFPIFFRPGKKERDYLLFCKSEFGSCNLVFEFRSGEWSSPENFEFLRKNSLNYCAVDEPKLKGLVSFQPEITGQSAYLRLHGRNPNWFSASVSERYNYLYSEDELSEFMPFVKKIGALSGSSFVMFNNCHAGSAIKNAMLLKKMLDKIR